jgi:hypothetical protein
LAWAYPDVFNKTKDDPSFDGTVMNWVLLSFAVITPLSAALGMAFSRREKALSHIATFKATAIHLFSSHVCWDWPKKGQNPTGRAASDVDWLEHTDQVLTTLCNMCSDLVRMLTLPTGSRARHRVFSYGKKQREVLKSISRKLHRSILEEMNFLTDKCEIVKREGLPPK